MNSPWLSFFLLALAASFLPLQFGMEISLLGKDDGIKNGFSFSAGVALFRVVLVVGLLEKIDNWFNEAMPYVMVGILFVIGLYFIMSGTTDVMHFLAI